MSHDGIKREDEPVALPTEPRRVRVPLEMAATWACTCGFRVGISDKDECARIFLAVTSGMGASRPCPRCGAICELYEKPPEQKLSVVKGGLPPGMRNRDERRATAAQLRHQVGGLVGADGKPVKRST